MPPRAEGAQRADILKWEPEELDKIILGRNPSRSNLDTDLRIEELARSIAEHGQLQPGVIRRESGGGGVLVAGFRRLAAIRLINSDPAAYGARGPLAFRASLVSCTDEEALALNLVENLQRLDLNPVDRAHSARELQRLGWEQQRIAGAMGCSTSTVSALLSLLQLPGRTLRQVAAGKLTEGAARKLRGLPEEQVLELTAQIEAGARPAEVVRAATQRKREAGATVALSLAEIRKALEEQGSDQALAILAWTRGEAPLEAAELADFPAPSLKQIRGGK